MLINSTWLTNYTEHELTDDPTDEISYNSHWHDLIDTKKIVNSICIWLIWLIWHFDLDDTFGTSDTDWSRFDSLDWLTWFTLDSNYIITDSQLLTHWLTIPDADLTEPRQPQRRHQWLIQTTTCWPQRHSIYLNSWPKLDWTTWLHRLTPLVQ